MLYAVIPENSLMALGRRYIILPEGICYLGLWGNTKTLINLPYIPVN